MLKQLKPDMLRLLELKAEIAKYEQMLLQYSNIKDTRNYNAQKSERIRAKVKELEACFKKLYKKWF